LVLTLYKEFFDSILDGSKKVEKRTKSAYWKKRLLNKTITAIEFRNGYRKNCPHFQAGISKILSTRKHILLHISQIFLPVYTYIQYSQNQKIVVVKTFRRKEE
jgi:hypothetical protein